MQLVAWLAATIAHFDAPPIPVDPAKRPVVLVHGIHSCGADMERMARFFRAQGRKVIAPTLTPNGGAVPLEVLAQQLAETVEKELPGQQFDLVGFSMGGLISRYYVQRLGGLKRVAHFVTMATPHQGTKMAMLRRAPGVIQMRPGSAFLRDLDRDAEQLRAVKFTSFYTPLDTVIVPARSSEVAQAKNVRFWAAMHPSWILEKKCLLAVAQVLAE